MSADLSGGEIRRYSRHIVIPEIGIEGQKKLKEASVLIVGTGGLGSAIALYLAAAGVGCIGLVDYDCVELSNLQRQVAYSTFNLGQLKVDSASRRLLDLNPTIQVNRYPTQFTIENAAAISSRYDIFLDGSDNLPTRYLINNISIKTGKPYIYGSVFRFEGQVSVFEPGSGPCFGCIFPEPRRNEIVVSNAVSPEGSGVLSTLPGTIGTLQATEALQIILGFRPTLSGWLLLYDATDMSFQKIRLKKDPNCEYCGAPISTHGAKK